MTEAGTGAGAAGAPDREEVAARVRDLLAEALHRDVSEIGLDDRLREDLGAESIDMMSLIFELEDVYGRQIEDDQLARLTTVRSVVDFLCEGEPAG